MKQGKEPVRKADYCQETCDSLPEEEGFLDLAGKETGFRKPSILLHSCCGPCSTACIKRLIGDYDITVFYYNPNIDDEEEYRKRKETQMEFLRKYNDNLEGTKVAFLEAPYDPERFLEEVAGLEEEPEGGKRCAGCFHLRLAKTAETAAMMHFDCFGTTLTVSPHKDYDTISAIGKKLSALYGVDYLDANFKKKDGYKTSIEMSKEYGLYRQNYCGCRFSKWEPEEPDETDSDCTETDSNER